jgi:CHAD domain-containing protein
MARRLRCAQRPPASGGYSVQKGGKEGVVSAVSAVQAEIERETKFVADSIDVDALDGEPLEPRVFTSVYYDTDNQRLASLGFTLRRRDEHGENHWQLKLPRANGRLELEEPGNPAEPPPKIDSLLKAILRGRPVTQRATLRTHRCGRRIDGVELTVDDVEVLEGQHVLERFSEIEAEAVDGSEERLQTVEEQLRRAGARRLDEHSKLERVLGQQCRRRPKPKRGAPALDHLRAYIATQLKELLAHDPGVRVGEDSEDVHDMRVAVRRLRSALRIARPMLDRNWAEELRSELDWLADALGPVRDLDVIREDLAAELASLDAGQDVTGARLLEPLKGQQERVRRKLIATLDSQRYLALLDRIEQAGEALPVVRCDLSVEGMATKQFRKLRKRVKSLGPDPSSAALHKTRIRLKRARYAAELAARTTGTPAKRVIKRAEHLQDILGQHQDAIVAQRHIRDLARTVGDRETALVAGRLIERQHHRATDARAQLPRAWARIDQAAKAAWS